MKSLEINDEIDYFQNEMNHDKMILNLIDSEID
jgi:hypothetical protein